MANGGVDRRTAPNVHGTLRLRHSVFLEGEEKINPANREYGHLREWFEKRARFYDKRPDGRPRPNGVVYGADLDATGWLSPLLQQRDRIHIHRDPVAGRQMPRFAEQPQYFLQQFRART